MFILHALTDCCSKFCKKAEYVVKTDDDIYMDLYATYTTIQALMASRTNRKVLTVSMMMMMMMMSVMMMLRSTSAAS